MNLCQVSLGFFLAVLLPLILFVKQLPGERLDRLFYPPLPPLLRNFL